MSQQPLSVAVIGAGMAGRGHAAGYRQVNTVFGEGLPPVRLAAIADTNEPLARDGARRYGFEKAVSSWEEVVADPTIDARSEEHTSELQSRQYLVCRLLLEKKNEMICIFHVPSPLRQPASIVVSPLI